MKNIFIFTVAGLISISSAYGQAKEKKEKDKFLVGKVFTIEIIETGKKKPGKPNPDKISFKLEKLNSKYTKNEYDIASAVYSATIDSASGEKIFSFVATGKNSWEEELKWEGTVTGDDIKGTIILSKKEKVKKEYSFTGTLKTKKKK
ncbi:MAG: hypothetical protein V1781_01885 [Bacteroidota bacterium]